MHYYLTALAIVAGTCFAFGILFVFTGLRRKDGSGSTVLFSLFALSYAAVILTGMANYSATSLDDWLSSARLDGVFVVLTWCLLIGYVAVYTGAKPRIFLALLLAAFVSSGIANVVRPNLIYDEIMGLAAVTLPWGEQLAYVEATDSIWATVFLVANLVTMGYVLVACTLQFLRGERQPALVLGAGMAWFIMTIIVDILVDLGIAPLYLGDFGFLGLAIALGLQLTNEVIRTEEELAQHRRELEAMVEQRTSQLQGANRDLTALNRITQMLASVPGLPAALEQVSEAVANLFSAQQVYIVLPSAEEAGLQVTVGYQQESGPVGVTPLHVSLAEAPYFERVLNQTESLSLTDVQSLPVAAPMRELIAGQGIESAMLVPLVVRGSAIGLLAVASDESGRVFTPDQVRLAETIAGDVAGAIENARLFDQARSAAVSEERARIARDLHDSVTQTLYSASLIAEALPRVWDRNPEQVGGSLATLLQLLRGALAEMRTLLFELRPAALEDTSLDRLLHQQADLLTGRTRTPVEVTVQGETDLPVEVKIALYRIAQEAFNNIVKHAGASQVTATLQHLPDGVKLAIQDDGRGFDPTSVPPERMGLRIMRERAGAVGAELVVDSAPGEGTRVAVEWTADEGRGTKDEGGRVDALQV
jgi:signal transduction histidine kinase